MDPRIPLLSAFFASRLPPAAMLESPAETANWLPFLQAVGMASSVSRSLLLSCAETVSRAYLHWEEQVRARAAAAAARGATTPPSEVAREVAELESIKADARMVTSYLFTKYKLLAAENTERDNHPGSHPGSSINTSSSSSRSAAGSATSSASDPEVRQWLRALGRLHIAQKWQEPPSNCRARVATSSVGGLVPFEVRNVAEGYKAFVPSLKSNDCKGDCALLYIQGSILPPVSLSRTHSACWSVRHIVRVRKAPMSL